jgi:hypothetical protein
MTHNNPRIFKTSSNGMVWYALDNGMVCIANAWKCMWQWKCALVWYMAMVCIGNEISIVWYALVIWYGMVCMVCIGIGNGNGNGMVCIGNGI